MIETKILDAAVGIQRQDVIDKSETTVLPSLANGVITGHFKRGRMDKPFKVTAKNYKALLGYDPSNPSYLAVEDAFKNGVNELSILRVGQVGGGNGSGGGAPIQCTPTLKEINEIYRNEPIGAVHARYRVDGGAWVDYVGDASSYKSSIIGDFFDTIKVDGGIAIETSGERGNTTDWIDYCTPFRSYRGDSPLAGAADIEPFNYGQDFVLRKRYTTIEFKVTQNNVNDLVYFAFGGDYIATSCAIAGWEGL